MEAVRSLTIENRPAEARSHNLCPKTPAARIDGWENWVRFVTAMRRWAHPRAMKMGNGVVARCDEFRWRGVGRGILPADTLSSVSVKRSLTLVQPLSPTIRRLASFFRFPAGLNGIFGANSTAKSAPAAIVVIQPAILFCKWSLGLFGNLPARPGRSQRRRL